MDINKVPKGGEAGKVLDVIIDATKEMPPEKRVNVLFPIFVFLLASAALFWVLNHFINSAEAKEEKSDRYNESLIENRKLYYEEKIRGLEIEGRQKDSTIFILSNEKVELNQKMKSIVESQDLMKKILRIK